MAIALPRYIEIETSRYCNRKCAWCPNGTYGHRQQQQLMRWDLLVKILDELRHLKYENWVAFHNYNEPLANPRILSELAFANEHLTSCPTSIFSNGDYLDTQNLQSLVDVRLSYLRITLYPAANISAPGVVRGSERIERWLNAKGLNSLLNWEEKKVRQGLAMTGAIEGLRVEVIDPDLSTYNWRGGTAPMIPGRWRDSPCFMTHHSASIDYKGRFKMCCNVFSDIKEHEQYIVGSLEEFSFLELWNSDIMCKYRAAHSTADWADSAICRKCTQQLPESQIRSALSSKGLKNE